MSSHFVSCPLCGNSFHRSMVHSHAAGCGTAPPPPKAKPPPLTPPTIPPPLTTTGTSSTTTTNTTTSSSTTTNNNNKYGSLRPFTSADLGPKRKRGLDQPTAEFEHLVVLDFEWTCDDRRAIHPRAEIIEFSCVLVSTLPRPAAIVAQFQQYVKPEHNPKLTKFCTKLTGITTSMLDDVGVPLKVAIARFHTWLKEHNIIEKSKQDNLCPVPSSSSRRRSREREKFAIITWSDADLGMTLPRQMQALSLSRRAWFDHWINLKLSFTSVYKKSSSGLKRCVESIGLTFEGRAHSGLVDSINTAKIVVDMINKQNFTFRTCTRFLDDEWEMIGSKRSNEKRAKRE